MHPLIYVTRISLIPALQILAREEGVSNTSIADTYTRPSHVSRSTICSYMPSFMGIASSGRYPDEGEGCIPCIHCCMTGRRGRSDNGEDAGQSSASSMGPFADALGINTGVAFWLCVAQLPVMVGLALNYPTVRIDLFSTSIRVAFDPSPIRR